MLRQSALKTQLSPFSTKNVSRMCLEGSIIPLMCLESKMISPFTHKKMERLTTKLLHCKKAIFVTPWAFFIGFSFLLSKWLFTETHVCSIIPNTWRHIFTIHKSCTIVRRWSVFEHLPLLSCDFSCPQPHFSPHFRFYFSTKTQKNSFKILHLYIHLVFKI